jgi:hypothetical protein
MARPSIQTAVTEKVRAYIAQALKTSPELMPLSTFAVAKAIGNDRRVLKKYRLDEEIANAAKVQKRARRIGADATRRTQDERIEALNLERNRTAAQVNALLGRLALIEGNAKRLGIDPEELYRPLLPPDRRVPRIFAKRRS